MSPNTPMRPYDREQLREEFRNAEPFPFVFIENFLEEGFAKEVAAAYPSFDEAKTRGRTFDALNEKNKVQLPDVGSFPDPIRRLNQAVSSEAFLKDLEYITGIDKLVYDHTLNGGGMHITGARGRLDVHVDFNYQSEQGLYRRLNILIYLNQDWRDEWGGAVELWDQKVKHCHHSIKPRMNRCVIFETSEISYHGVEPVTCPPDIARISFAAYYYTKEPPATWSGEHHTTIFQARPDEKFRRYVLMPLQRIQSDAIPMAKQIVKRIIGRA